ncbi:hypothetical protein A3C87_01250 [Candidatus Kaiserbacteria bacterium RIFCSPHIGHO2_02_FULL_49_34]|uniref:Pyrrolo-quinoline quinone repeat domain-containing protein n=1 Tax=Candidatus Kaiserbacteria bacterium RIFCSPHIGHO2_02_FULL_49_34 TaxID=1798491 RepID=A0A1F6DL97_9BACT|nr:MAG: hypothetical protein A3C87_01250 [Candidatus Kaiserbacteria bacterium RIFCSPHIGHO2_02_FULL_49_34]
MDETQTFFAEQIANRCMATADVQPIDLDNENPAHWLMDLRKVILTPAVLDRYASSFLEQHAAHYPFQVCGLETAAIPLVAAIVMKSQMIGTPVNGFYIKKSRKKSGLLSIIEGTVQNEKVILVDDILNSGNSFIRQVEVLEKLRAETPTLNKLAIVSVFSIVRFRNLDFYTYFSQRNIAVTSLLTLDDLHEHIKKTKPQLNVRNLPARIDEIPTPNNFEISWYWKGSKPNYFYVVPKSAPLVHDGKLYFGTDSGDFVCLNNATGELVWQYRVPFGSKKKLIFSSPCLVTIKKKTFVCFGAYDGNLYLLDAQTGTKKWIFMEADWIGSSPCFSEKLGLIFIGMEYGLFKKRGGVTAIDAATGKKVWEYRSEEFTHGSPIYSEKYNVVACGSNDKKLHVLSAKTGELIWDYETISEIKYAPCIDEKRGQIIFGGIGGDHEDSERGAIYVCDIKTGEPRFTYTDLHFGIYSTPIVYKNIIIVTSLDKIIHAFDVGTGKSVWKFATPARIFASPTIIDGRLYVGQNSGHLYELDPETGKVNSLTLVTERITNKIAHDPEMGMYFLPTFANEIYALTRKR